VFVAQRDQGYDIEALELIGAPQHAILHVRPTGPHQIGDIELEGGVYNVFRIDNNTVTALNDYRNRDDALRAAGLAGEATDSS
jgi:hypothetical protein